MQDASSDFWDVAVVGAGVSGAYAAWRLREAGAASPTLAPLAAKRSDGKLRVALFEFGGRVGGRLFSMSVPGLSDLPIELGGMRFLSSHLRVASLVRKFGLEFRDLPVQDPNGRNLFYLRGRHFSAAEWDRPGFIPPYLLDRGERSRSPGQLLIEVALRHRHEAERLRDVGFRNLLLNELSAEAYQLIRDASGYDTLVNNWSAAEAIPFLLADFDPRLSYFALRKGFQALPLELVDRFGKAGGVFFPRHRLCRLDRESNGLRLVFDTAESPPENVRRVAKPTEVKARHVVLAMPRRSIERLHPDSFLFDGPQFGDDLDAVVPQPGFKIFAAYRRVWWYEARRVSAGRSVTDLPLRQCYYWGAEPRFRVDDKSPDTDCNSVLMASYNDGGAVEFWAGLARNAERYRPPASVCPPGVPIPDPDPEVSASAAMVAELQDQLRELHGLNSLADPADAGIIEPYAVFYRDWTAEPFGGGWHFWRIGARARAVMNRMRQPAPPDPLYICGEAWSRQQGWVEGALESADEILEVALRLPRPDWLTQSRIE